MKYRIQKKIKRERGERLVSRAEHRRERFIVRSSSSSSLLLTANVTSKGRMPAAGPQRTRAVRAPMSIALGTLPAASGSYPFISVGHFFVGLPRLQCLYALLILVLAYYSACPPQPLYRIGAI